MLIMSILFYLNILASVKHATNACKNQHPIYSLIANAAQCIIVYNIEMDEIC